MSEPFGAPGWCSAGPWAVRAAEPAALTAGDRGCYARARTRTCTAPENGEELIPEANLFCSNPVAVTGSPQVLGSGAAADHIAFMPSPGASLSHSPVADGGEGMSEKGRHRSQRLFTSPPRTRGVRRSCAKMREGADCRSAA